VFRRISPCDAPCCLRPKSEGSAFGFHSFRGHTGSLALRPGDSLAILVDAFVNRLQESQFPSFLLFKLRGLNFLPRWDSHPLFMPAFAGRTLAGSNLPHADFLANFVVPSHQPRVRDGRLFVGFISERQTANSCETLFSLSDTAAFTSYVGRRPPTTWCKSAQNGAQASIRSCCLPSGHCRFQGMLKWVLPGMISRSREAGTIASWPVLAWVQLR
jgi:hypothetical protein